MEHNAAFQPIAECGTSPETRGISVKLIGPNKLSRAFQPIAECGTLPEGVPLPVLEVEPPLVIHDQNIPRPEQFTLYITNYCTYIGTKNIYVF
jgi:hypothetical protein